MAVITIIYLIMALLLFYLAYSIWKLKKVHWIAGYDPNKHDDVKIARVTGISLSLMGSTYLICAVVSELFTGIEFVTIGLSSLLVIVIAFASINSSNKAKK